mmetsp:Transcript_52091/g.153685  ORF Transcript_52091/g.153685 Transcript_52091/m.153685 type:complete len:245 (+) Transcript_52091:2634-3368(+)
MNTEPAPTRQSLRNRLRVHLRLNKYLPVVPLLGRRHGEGEQGERVDFHHESEVAEGPDDVLVIACPGQTREEAHETEQGDGQVDDDQLPGDREVGQHDKAAEHAVCEHAAVRLRPGLRSSRGVLEPEEVCQVLVGKPDSAHQVEDKARERQHLPHTEPLCEGVGAQEVLHEEAEPEIEQRIGAMHLCRAASAGDAKDHDQEGDAGAQAREDRADPRHAQDPPPLVRGLDLRVGEVHYPPPLQDR